MAERKQPSGAMAKPKRLAIRTSVADDWVRMLATKGKMPLPRFLWGIFAQKIGPVTHPTSSAPPNNLAAV